MKQQKSGMPVGISMAPPQKSKRPQPGQALTKDDWDPTSLIRQKAFALYEARRDMCHGGSELDDWLQAEAQVRKALE